MDIQLHADRDQEALVHGAEIEWVPSPMPGVERRMLERSGGEIALASSIVRYAARSRFLPHAHPLGEEFMVLEGTFSDEDGDYPAGTYVRNPPGSAHSPFSRDGCVIFVKLRQMQADERETVRIHPHEYQWVSTAEGRRRASLYANRRISIALEKLDPGSAACPGATDGGLEILVLSGRIALPDRHASLGPWSWLRTRAALAGVRAGAEGALLWVKRGHLKVAE